MKKRIVLTGVILISTVFVFAQKHKFIEKYLEKTLNSEAAPNTGPAPDYNNLVFWAASPYKHSTADSIPVLLKNEICDKRADVFFIHPTSYLGNNNEDDMLQPGTNKMKILESLKKVSWNADLTDTLVNNRTDSRTMLYQASVFNGSCRIFAPRYRQANIKAFFIRNSPEAQQAFDLAYSDIKAAFEYYLKHENNGRPIIIASHSQGSLHAIRLLQDYFDGTALQKQLVCAYIIGYQIPTNAFKNIPVGNTPDATGCFVGWRSYVKGEISNAVKMENGNSVCVNPLNWTTSTEWLPESKNDGSLYSFKMIIPNAVSAGIEPSSKILWVTLPKELSVKMKKLKNLHVYDYNLFWMNIRENVKQRIDAYFNKKS
jgi:hypothetical protein